MKKFKELQSEVNQITGFRFVNKAQTDSKEPGEKKETKDSYATTR